MNLKSKIKQRKIAVQHRLTSPKQPICGPFKFSQAFSEIRIRGKWLQTFGFEPGSKALITCHDKKLVITVLDNE